MHNKRLFRSSGVDLRIALQISSISANRYLGFQTRHVESQQADRDSCRSRRTSADRAEGENLSRPSGANLDITVTAMQHLQS